MLSRIIALAIFLITTAAIQADYYLIRVDLTKPLDKGYLCRRRVVLV